MKKRNKKKGVPMPRWTRKDRAALRRLYSWTDNESLGWLFGRSVSSVATLASRLGLRKSPGRLVDMGRENVARRWNPCA
jgi:hypothetical protein